MNTSKDGPELPCFYLKFCMINFGNSVSLLALNYGKLKVFPFSIHIFIWVNALFRSEEVTNPNCELYKYSELFNYSDFHHQY